MDELSKVAIIVVSCSKYADIWPIFISQFVENWANCRFKKYLISDMPVSKFSNPCITNLFVKYDMGWSENIKATLGAVTEEYVLYIAEDYLLNSKVDNELVNNIICNAIHDDANYVLMSGCIESDCYKNKFYGTLEPGREYRTSVYFSLFKKEVLLALLKDNESAWEFETEGAVRSKVFDKFFVTYRNCFSIIGPHSSVIKGKWSKQAIKELRSLGYNVEDFERPVFTTLETICLFAKMRLSKIIRSFIPFSMRLNIIRIKNMRV